ncbi:ROK family transcriptional regulator [Paenibacillus sp. J5C_2022]|uniref:ROK family transcriptional regulator n=1 Tax=Paenibacillus sp. J5C2022 TaxID=2977129 RepID=UPI0021D144C7|nr:ROK family transcriptional regulator [Paenibacillus sp. J5C2022]MCU6712739.1 ROK family transcriptional regulator [Paenibacillus sp. J5C2022]
MNAKSGYLRQVKQSNLSQVLKCIWSMEPVSRIELVEKTGLTSGTITNLTQDLIKVGLLREEELSTGHVGRRRVNLRLNPQRLKMIGIDIGRTSYEVVITDLTGQTLRSTEHPLSASDTPEQVLFAVSASLKGMTADMGLQQSDILGAGLSIPGPMNLQEGTLLVPPNFASWEYYPVKRELEARLGMDILMNDDARTSALAERWFGYGRKEPNFVYVTMGQGIGGGIVSDGEVLQGSNGLYGQVGHITVMPDGELCECGNTGCWETVGSIPGILRRWAHGAGAEHKTIDDFFTAVKEGEPRAERCLESTLKVMESTLTTLFNVYDPDLLILGGKLYPYLQGYLPRIQNHVKASVYPFFQHRVRIESASFGASQSAVGAASLVFGSLMERPLDVLEGLRSNEGA